ncbi:hypothetical protein QDA02_gp15 [Microbacterium phage Margaery]|uniref:Uncharacterized protein n=1 Tax=Microbacterium phage Margaery TaxID=2591217 RepID=A0A514DHQ5_9CAUD|nr:hypothetical protein QDA02_gp15 [Microbacterium phage Margaery]QDH93150.1 hypothetical protein PBI_MARGAERY_93 [Microbacterium phage Margaery]
MSDWRQSANYAKIVEESVAAFTEQANAEIEAGLTDNIVAALREKGWTVTPPPDTSNCPRGIAGCPLPAGHEHYSRTDEEIRAHRETAERRERGDGGTVQILVADDGATT